MGIVTKKNSGATRNSDSSVPIKLKFFSKRYKKLNNSRVRGIGTIGRSVRYTFYVSNSPSVLFLSSSTYVRNVETLCETFRCFFLRNKAGLFDNCLSLSLPTDVNDSLLPVPDDCILTVGRNTPHSSKRNPDIDCLFPVIIPSNTLWSIAVIGLVGEV